MKPIVPMLGKIRNATSRKAERVLQWTARSRGRCSRGDGRKPDVIRDRDGVLGHGGSRRESTLGATGPLEFGQDLVKVGGRLRRRAEWRNRGLQLLRLVALPLAAYDTWVVPLD